MNKQLEKNKIVIYQTNSGALELRTDIEQETLWLTQVQIAEIFNVQKSAISKHTKNIFEDGELQQKTTVSKMETVQKEGKREVSRAIEYYNLDLVLSIGYRVNSKQATRFRQWATQTLKKHIVDGYTINRSRITIHYQEFLKSVDTIKQLLPKGTVIDTKSVLELISMFADTWLSLDAYDKNTLITKGATKKRVELTADRTFSFNKKAPQ